MEIRKYKCSHCHKVFSGNYDSDYAYRHNGKNFCSWSCYRAYLRANNLLSEEEQVMADIKQHNKLVEGLETVKHAKLKQKVDTDFKILLKRCQKLHATAGGASK